MKLTINLFLNQINIEIQKTKKEILPPPRFEPGPLNTKQISNQCAREIFIQREGHGTVCVVVNQLWAWLFK